MYFRRMKQVEIGALVEVSYTLRADGPQGEELESCPDENPFVFRVGEEEVLEKFEEALLGKRVGEPFSLYLSCDDAYGHEQDDAIVALPKSTFMVDGKLDEEVMKVGEVVPLEDEDGHEVIGVVVELEGDVVHVDFNHPLAGLDLHFEGVVLAVGK